MENCLNTIETDYKDVQYFKKNINNVIETMIIKGERLVFAHVAERAGVTRFIIRQYPELRNYILDSMIHNKEIQVINQKIDRAVASLLRSNKNITFMGIINKCKFSSDYVYQNKYIKDRIRSVLMSR